MATWDPRGKGVLEEPHHNTYDIEFWGADGMCTSFYVAALAAAVEMGQALGQDITRYRERLRAGMRALDQDLFNGEYFIQKVQWQGLDAPNPLELKDTIGGHGYSPEARALLEKEGPKYQYGDGLPVRRRARRPGWPRCARVPVPVEPAKVTSHLEAVHRHNFRKDLSGHANPQRPHLRAAGRGRAAAVHVAARRASPRCPSCTATRCGPGIEYQVAAHLMMCGRVEPGLEIVRACRARYDGRVRNPFDEYECGHWYARAMASYAMLQGLTGARYDAVTRTLHLHPRIPGDFRAFLSTATGYGTVGVRGGKPFLDVRAGTIDVPEARVLAGLSRPARTRGGTMEGMAKIPFSVLDLSPIVQGGDAAQALRNTLDLARHAERWGYHRYWLAEHHNMPGIASAATAVVIGACRRAAPRRIRVGSGGIMLPNHAPLVIAEQFGTLESLFPGRIDLGVGRAPGTDQATAARAAPRPRQDADDFPRDVVELMAYFRAAAAGPARARRARRRARSARSGSWARACSARSWPPRSGCRTPSPRTSRPRS